MELEEKIPKKEKSTLFHTMPGWSPFSYSATHQNNKWISKGLSEGSRRMIDVGASGIQYGQSIFEGCFATKLNGEIYFF
ncbi:hypothetical protein AB835_05605 [Candidatus Endobugula sertula]|uniref:Uncharacterized protein n=1 Tax=Candidatus Endobugula sertula TaxID=62101 RepID=A0A1D2QQZ4_9GAMM|nr:hypothetical protein AB835_05605 [Candidatus Endobugula sertula]